jgi:hypothetical protein
MIERRRKQRRLPGGRTRDNDKFSCLDIIIAPRTITGTSPGSVA